MSFDDGAAFFMNYVTAYILLFDIGNVRSGHSILMHSIGGGVVRHKHDEYRRKNIYSDTTVLHHFRDKRSSSCVRT